MNISIESLKLAIKLLESHIILAYDLDLSRDIVIGIDDMNHKLENAINEFQHALNDLETK
jgi:hypothetical protein